MLITFMWCTHSCNQTSRQIATLININFSLVKRKEITHSVILYVILFTFRCQKSLMNTPPNQSVKWEWSSLLWKWPHRVILALEKFHFDVAMSAHKMEFHQSHDAHHQYGQIHLYAPRTLHLLPDASAKISSANHNHIMRPRNPGRCLHPRS